MNLNHSCTDAFCFLKNKETVTADVFKLISNENALKWLYAALIASRIIATPRSQNDVIKITVQKSCRACYIVIGM